MSLTEPTNIIVYANQIFKRWSKLADEKRHWLIGGLFEVAADCLTALDKNFHNNHLYPPLITSGYMASHLKRGVFVLKASLQSNGLYIVEGELQTQNPVTDETSADMVYYQRNDAFKRIYELELAVQARGWRIESKDPQTDIDIFAEKLGLKPTSREVRPILPRADLRVVGGTGLNPNPQSNVSLG